MRRIGSIAPLACPLFLIALTSCSTIDCKGENDSSSFLRSVPVDAQAAAGLPPPAQGEVLRRTWTLEDDGTFFVNQNIEKKESALGVNVAVLEPEDARRLAAEPFSGILVQWVDGSGAAARAGIIPDDVILSLAGKEVASRERLEFLVGQIGPGVPCDLEVLRRGARIQIKLEMGSQSQVVISRAFERKLAVLNDNPRTGLRLAELSDDVKPLVLGPAAEKGLLVTSILPGGPAFDSDLRVRDAVVKVGTVLTPTLKDYTTVIDAVPPGEKQPFTILRNGVTMVVPLTVEKSATTSWGFNFLGLAKYRKEPSSRHFSLIWGLLFNLTSCDSVRGEGSRTVNRHEHGWGAVLNLIEAKRTPHHGELRLLWLFPISWRSD